MCPEGKLRHVIGFCAGDFDKGCSIIYIGIADLDAKLYVAAASPPAGPHENKAALRQHGVEQTNGPAHIFKVFQFP